MKRYFSINVRISRKNGFSVPIAVEADEITEFDFEDDVIQKALDNGLMDSEDADSVSSVEEIEEYDFQQLSK